MARAKQAKSAGEGTPDAITLLKADHRQVEDWFGQFEKARDADRKQKLATQICNALKVHTTIEEEIFYPAFKEAGNRGEDAQLYFEAKEEHRAAGEMVLPDLLKTAPDSDEFGARAKVLKELIEHHAREEEREMFPRARELFDAAELRDLGQRMMERKESLLSGAGAGAALKRAGQGMVGAVASLVGAGDEGEEAAERGLGSRRGGSGSSGNGSRPPRSSSQRGASRARS